MEKRVENSTRQILQDSTTELGETIDAYLENNKSAVRKFAEDAEDEEALNILANGLEAELVRFMDANETTNKGTLADQSRNVLIKLQAALKAKGLDLPHVEHLSAFDPAIHVAYLSRFPFKKITRHDNESFLLNGRRLHVSRGFAEVEIALGGYSFSLITAHLKSKRKVSVADEAEMRLQEALRLRRIIDARLKANTDMNFAVPGDLNDYTKTKPPKALVASGQPEVADAGPG